MFVFKKCIHRKNHSERMHINVWDHSDISHEEFRIPCQEIVQRTQCENNFSKALRENKKQYKWFQTPKQWVLYLWFYYCVPVEVTMGGSSPDKGLGWEVTLFRGHFWSLDMIRTLKKKTIFVVITIIKRLLRVFRSLMKSRVQNILLNAGCRLYVVILWSVLCVLWAP